jgi:hypothetical protein
MMPSEILPLALDAVEDAAPSVLLGARAVVLRWRINRMTTAELQDQRWIYNIAIRMLHHPQDA